MPAGERPTSRPARSSTNENSPTCASASGRGGRGRRVVADAPRRRRAGDDLDQAHHRDRAEHEREVRHHEAEVEQHADRDEERRAEQDLQRHDLGERVLAELALADDETAEERAERHADAGQAGEERRAEADRHDRQQEQFGRAGARDPFQQRRHEPARDDQDDDDQRDGGAERFRQRQRIVFDHRRRRPTA